MNLFIIFVLIGVLLTLGAKYAATEIRKIISLFKPSHADDTTNRAIVSTALKHLSCQPKWTEEEGEASCSFSYQGGYFVIRVYGNNPFIHIIFPNFEETSLDNIASLRWAINDINSFNSPVKIIYTIQDESHMACTHALASVCINKYSAVPLLTQVFNNIFEARSAIASRLKENIDKSRDLSSRDLELANAEWKGEISLLHELVIGRQADIMPWHESHTDIIMTPRHLAATLMSITYFSPTSMTVVADGQVVATLTDTEAIAGYPLASALIADDRFAHSWAMLHIDYRPDGDPTPHQLCISLSAAHSAKSVLYYRVSITSIPAKLNLQPGQLLPAHDTSSHTLMAGYDLTPVKQRTDSIRYQWKEARQSPPTDNEANGLSATQRLLAACATPDLAQALCTGHALYLGHRYYEAIQPLHTAYSHYASSYSTLTPSEMRAYYEVCYLLGSCYYQLRLFDRAHYYLLATMPLGNVIYHEQFVNCLVSLGNLACMDYIDSAIEHFGQSVANGSADSNTQNLYYFLQRRKVELLLRSQQQDQAEAFLRTMLDGTPNTDYAIDQLARIQKERRT